MDRLGRMCVVVRCDSAVIDPGTEQYITWRNFDENVSKLETNKRVLTTSKDINQTKKKRKKKNKVTDKHDPRSIFKENQMLQMLESSSNLVLNVFSCAFIESKEANNLMQCD